MAIVQKNPLSAEKKHGKVTTTTWRHAGRKYRNPFPGPTL